MITVVLTLAGWGQFQVVGQAPQLVVPGKAFFVTDPARHRLTLPVGSPGWTVAWLAIGHPHLRDRLHQLIGATGSVVDIESDSLVAASLLHLVHGAMKMDFRDQFAAEMALCRFVLAFDRRVEQARENVLGGQRLMEQFRGRALASLAMPLAVATIASEFGMSRSHFSHFFRERTGVSPARFLAEVRIEKAAHMLRDTRDPVKTIAVTCGFANANHFAKVFHRLRHQTPTSFRRRLL
jgi:AraC-like DNA-binding protein